MPDPFFFLSTVELTDQDFARLLAAREKRRRKMERYTNTPEAAANREAFEKRWGKGVLLEDIPLLSPLDKEDEI